MIMTAGLIVSGCDGAKNPIENLSSSKHLARNSEGFDISGSIFTDANTSGQFDENETGIANATVHLFDSENTLVGTAVTNSSGFYIFEAFPAGSYTVQVDETTVVSTSTKYIGATTATAIDISIESDATGNDFGFEPKASKLVDDLKRNVLVTTSKGANYWSKQFRTALRGKGKADFSKSTLQAFVVQIRALLLPDPFLLPNGDGLQDAFNILDRPVKTDLEKLQRELLAAELNHMAGFGINGTDAALQLVLLGWGESLVQSNSTTNLAASGKTAPNTVATTTATLSSALQVFLRFNSQPGGGGGGQ